MVALRSITLFCMLLAASVASGQVAALTADFSATHGQLPSTGAPCCVHENSNASFKGF